MGILLRNTHKKQKAIETICRKMGMFHAAPAIEKWLPESLIVQEKYNRLLQENQQLRRRLDWYHETVKERRGLDRMIISLDKKMKALSDKINRDNNYGITNQTQIPEE